MPQQVNEQHDVPRHALRFEGAPVKFAKAIPPGEGQQLEHEIELLVRSAEPIYHWYWGKIVHDMAGMTVRKDSLPMDWCHRYDINVGVASNFQADPKTGLTASGRLISVQKDDRASEIILRGQAGVPYESSLDWSGPARIEWVDEGMSVEVNGTTFDGPGYVVREWNFQAVAICPHGADGSTRATFAQGDEPENVSVTLFSAGQLPMSKGTAPTPTPAGEAAPQQMSSTAPAVPATPPAPSREQFTAELKRFTDKFGAENGAKWFSEGKTYEQALELHADDVQAKFAAKDKEIGDLKQKLSAVPRGEEQPAGFSEGGDPKGQSQGGSTTPAKFAHLGDNLSRFAAAIKLPK